MPRRGRSSSDSVSISKEPFMRARALFVMSVMLALTAGALTAAAATRPVALDDFSRFQDVRDPHVSPDGEWVLYTVSVADPQADRNRTDIWKVKWDGSQQTRVSYGSDSPSAPRWSPDGKYISFLSSRAGGEAHGPQVWVMDRSGGEPRQLTQLKGRIASYEWSPDSTRLLLVYRDADGSEPEPPRGDNARPPAPKPIVINKYQFKRDVQGYLTDSARSRVYVYDIAERKVEMLTADGDYEESNPVWSPDGRRVAFVSNHDKNWERTRNNDVFVVDARSGSKSRQLTTWQGVDGGALAWSPDGTQI